MAEVTQILCPKCHKPNLRRARFCQHCGHDVVLNNERPSDKRRYVITRVIKQGGQGAVYEGIDEDGQVFAIKEMLDRFTDTKERHEAIERFNAEAELLQSLNHPRIPRIYSHFTDEGRHYLTMDFVRGKDLEQIVEEHGLLSETQALEYTDQICDVLVYLHGKGLIYRDMKPSNVMIEEISGGVKLVDFGITKLFKPTERGTQIGTPGYAPPEQYQGLATPASDIYALGATLHHVLTGRDPTEQMPFDFPPASSINSSISKQTSDALQRALQKIPQDRFATMSDFWDALRPERARRPAQVRVAQPTVMLPASPAAQVAGAPAMAGAAQPRPAAP
ncbi:MAG: protein kinase, partial [Oscillochloris sp.]|nr:protein kinase [Oscillochloris sp.]